MDNTIIDTNNEIEPNGHEQEKTNEKIKDNTDAIGKSGGKKPGTDQKTEAKKNENISDAE